MELNIEDNTSIKDLQQQFAAFYPYLQLEFSKNLRSAGMLIPRVQYARPEERVLKPGEILGPLQLRFSNDTTVAGLLKDFEDIGVVAQVFRKSGNLWIETSLTKDWTLERQDTEAKLINAQ